MFPYPFSFLSTSAAGLADIDNAFSMEFDGLDDYMTTGINLGYTNYPNLSLSCWVKMDNTALTNYTSYCPIGVLAGSYINSSAMNIYRNATVSLVKVQGAATAVFGTTDLGDDNWHHIVSTYAYDAAGTIVNVYVDGNSTPEIVNAALRSYGPLTGDLILGTPRITPLFRPFLGNVDEVAAFDYILSTDDIADIFNATSTGKTADLSAMSTPPVAWYRMGD